jgi:type IV secretion system protein VirB11
LRAVPRPLIAEAVNVIVHIAGRGTARKVENIFRLTGLTPDGYRLEPISREGGAA